MAHDDGEDCDDDRDDDDDGDDKNDDDNDNDDDVEKRTAYSLPSHSLEGISSFCFPSCVGKVLLCLFQGAIGSNENDHFAIASSGTPRTSPK